MDTSSRPAMGDAPSVGVSPDHDEGRDAATTGGASFALSRRRSGAHESRGSARLESAQAPRTTTQVGGAARSPSGGGRTKCSVTRRAREPTNPRRSRAVCLVKRSGPLLGCRNPHQRCPPRRRDDCVRPATRGPLRGPSRRLGPDGRPVRRHRSHVGRRLRRKSVATRHPGPRRRRRPADRRPTANRRTIRSRRRE